MGNPVEDDPELAQAIGLLAGRWGLLELMVEWLFATVAGVTEKRASVLFSFHRSVNTQRDVIKALLREFPLISDDLSVQVTQALNEYVLLAPQRNQVIHFPFGWDTEVDPAALYKMARNKSAGDAYSKVPMTAADIRALAERTAELQQRILALQLAILETVAVQLRDAPKQGVT